MKSIETTSNSIVAVNSTPKSDIIAATLVGLRIKPADFNVNSLLLKKYFPVEH